MADRPARVVVFAPDLGDRTQIEAAVGPVELVRRVDDLVAAAVGADVVVVDLVRPGIRDVLALIVDRAGRVVGFGPHVETDLLAAAAVTGVEALPRSRFFADIASVLGIHR